MDLSFLFATLMRFAHIAGAIVVLGGLFRAQISGLNAVDSYRKWLTSGAVVLVLSGAWQFMLRMHDAPKGWHAGIGIKILLALHVVAVSILLGRAGLAEAKRARLARGAVISGWIVVLVGAFLHNLK
jgi:hypothetical protein